MDGPFGSISRRRKAPGYFTADLAMAVAGAALLAGLAVTVTFGAMDRASAPRNAVFAGQQIQAFTHRAGFRGRAAAIGVNRIVQTPTGANAVLGPACAVNPGGAAASAQAQYRSCRLCASAAGVPGFLALPSGRCRFNTAGTEAIACTTNAAAVRLSNPRQAAITETEPLFGIFLPAGDLAEAAEIEHRINSYLSDALGLPGFNQAGGSREQVRAGSYRPGRARAGALFSRHAGGVLVCL